MSSKVPPRWPQEVEYIRAQRYHSSVPQELRNYLCPKTKAKGNWGFAAGDPPVVIKIIAVDDHPARGQRGLFAARKIPPRTHIIDYIGEVHTDDRPNSNYDISLMRTSEGVSVGVDASCVGNEARFINDYRGVAARPNALFEERRNSRGELCMAVWSGKDEIKKGQEILVSYGKSFWQARCAEPTTE